METMITAGNKFNSKITDTTCMQHSVSLPVLEALLAQVNSTDTQKVLDKTLIYYVHHPLQTSINVIDSLVALGASYGNIFILGKKYSQCDDVVSSLVLRGVHYQKSSKQSRIGQYATSFIRDINWLWHRLTLHLNDKIENILILDHGGHAVNYMPFELLENYRVIGIEKTSAGFFDLDKRGMPLFPMIDVANCTSKKSLESPLIAKSIVNKLFSHLPKSDVNVNYGVVGLGAIGRAIIEQLIERGQNFTVFDVNPDLIEIYQKDSKFVCATSTQEVISNCDWIFGCSGRDITQSSIDQIRLSSSDKTFVSCSSEDKEFLSLLRYIDLNSSLKFEPFDTVVYHTSPGAVIRLLRGGFPMNFDNTGESVPANEIQLTRALVVGAVLQAIQFFNDEKILANPAIYPLNLDVQQFIVSEWLQQQNARKDLGSVDNCSITPT